MRKFYLIHHRDKYLSPPLQNLIDMVDQWVSEYLRELHRCAFPLKPACRWMV